MHFSDPRRVMLAVYGDVPKWVGRRDDRGFALAAFGRDGLSLCHASTRLRGDPELVLEAVINNGLALQFASAECQADKGIVVTAVHGNALALQHASMELRADKDVVLEAVRKKGSALEFASMQLQAEEDLVLEAVAKFGEALQWASPACQATRRIVHVAVKQNGIALRWACQELQADREIVLEAVKSNGEALRYASTELRADREVVIEALKNQGAAFGYASQDLQADQGFVLEAVRHNGKSFLSTSPEYRLNKDNVLLAARYCKDDQDGKLCYNQAPLSFKKAMPWWSFSQVSWSSIAVAGQDAPVLSTKVTRIPAFGVSEMAKFRCEATMLSGSTFTIDISDSPSTDWWGEERHQPILNDLAERMSQEVSNHTEAKDMNQVFLTFSLKNGETRVASPWDWNKPLSDYSQQTPALFDDARRPMFMKVGDRMQELVRRVGALKPRSLRRSTGLYCTPLNS